MKNRAPVEGSRLDFQAAASARRRLTAWTELGDILFTQTAPRQSSSLHVQSLPPLPWSSVHVHAHPRGPGTPTSSLLGSQLKHLSGGASRGSCACPDGSWCAGFVLHQVAPSHLCLSPAVSFTGRWQVCFSPLSASSVRPGHSQGVSGRNASPAGKSGGGGKLKLGKDAPKGCFLPFGVRWDSNGTISR